MPQLEVYQKRTKVCSKTMDYQCYQKSISVRDKLYKEMIKANNDQTKKRKHKICKTYRNKIVDLFRVSRKSHYQKCFEENKKSFRDIVYSKKSKKNNTPSSLLIDEKTSNNIPPTRKHYTDYLKHPNPETFFISPTTPEEIKGCVRYIFASLFFKSKQKHLSN